MSNKIISDYRSEAHQGTIKLVDDKGNSKTCIGTKPIILSNQWKPVKVKKGDIITMDGKDYRVLKMTDTVAEVLCMYDASSNVKFDSEESDYNSIYAGKNIDTYCNDTFYNGLSSSMKIAIVDKTFTQDRWDKEISYTWDEHYTGKDDPTTYYLILKNATYGSSITRHCYCLSIQDVLDYLDATTSMGEYDTTLTTTNLWKMFWNEPFQSAKFTWLRSASSLGTVSAFCVNSTGGNCNLNENSVRAALAARPAFQIDLSKVDYAIL